MSNDNGIDNYAHPDYLNASAKLRQIDPLAPNPSWLWGYTKDGRTVYFPNSYKAGYKSVLFGNLTVTLDLAVIGQLSDGTWAYLPSFREGIRDCINELKTAALAEAQRRMFDETEKIKVELERQQRSAQEERRQREELERRLKETQEKVASLEQDKKKNTDKNDAK